MDMLSSLPDEVICAILSFLPTKGSVQTSILSKRWRCLWTRVPVLEFTCHPYVSTERVSSKIIGKVMLQHKLNINTFILNYQEHDLSDYELESWIDNVAARNIRNLVINLDYQTKLPQCLFTCKSLVSLTLVSSGDIPVGGIVDFPALKKLELLYIGFDSDESLPHLLFGCPVLEELIVDSWGSLNKVVCSPTITKLTIISLSGDRAEPEKMKLDSPALRYLRLSTCTYQIFSGGTLSSLNEADVDFFSCARGSDDESDEDDEQEKFALCHRSVFEFLGKMRNVSCLKLSLGHLTVYDDTFYVLAPKIHNLTELELSGDCRFVPIFLENANSLRLLKIGSFFELWRDPKQVPPCLISHLETVNLVNFWWSMYHHLDMIKYILRNGKVLKRLGITTLYNPSELGWRKNFRLRSLLASFERASQMCEVALD